ncbi:GntR family transcriptional regulator [Galactobacter valiniphilus]|uniref:GntR family transcriptional regulator n=1 Tax=Galactobacter valiniphilus TaxID=2676122 RepID=UPI0037367DA8
MANTGDTLIELVKHDILEGVWPPGSRLSPADLAVKYAASKSVVREALATLSGTGLVTLSPNRGFFVMSLSLRELRVLTDLRSYSEGIALRMSIERGDEAWESQLVAAHYQLERAHRRRAENPNRTDHNWATQHRIFHTKLVEASGIPLLTATAGNLADATELYRRWSATGLAGSRRNVEGEHRAILEAALDRDADRATALLQDHYETTLSVLLDAGLVGEAPQASVETPAQEG